MLSLICAVCHLVSYLSTVFTVSDHTTLLVQAVSWKLVSLPIWESIAQRKCPCSSGLSTENPQPFYMCCVAPAILTMLSVYAEIRLLL